MSLEPPPRQLQPASRLSTIPPDESYSQGETHQNWQDRYYCEWLNTQEGQQWIDDQAADQQVRQGAYF
jgi:hypothetical protein